MPIAYTVLISFVFVWGAEYFVYKCLMSAASVSVLAIGSWSFAVAAVLLGLHLLIRPVRDPAEKKPRWWLMLIIGGNAILVNLCWLYGIDFTSGTQVAALSRSDVLFTLFISAVIVKERIRKGDLPWIALALVGVFALVGFNPLKYRFGGVGDALTLGAALGLSVNAFMIKALSRELHHLKIAFYNTCINAVGLGIMMLLTDPNPLAFAQGETSTLVYMLVLMGMVYIWFCMYYYCLDHLPIWQVRIVTLLVPGVTAVLELFLRHQALRLHQFAGMTLLTAGAAAIIIRHAQARLNNAKERNRSGSLARDSSAS